MTLRELFWMAEGRQRETWNHTAQILAMLYNTHRGPKTRTMKPAEFHPMAGPKRRATEKADIGVLKQVFVRKPRG